MCLISCADSRGCSSNSNTYGDMRKLMFWGVTDLACTGGGVPAKDSPHTAKAPLYVFPSRSWCTGGVPGYEIPCPISHWIPRTFKLNITIKGCTGAVPGHIYIYTIWRNMYRGCTGIYIYIYQKQIYSKSVPGMYRNIYIYIRFGECCTGPACTGARPNFCMLPYIYIGVHWFAQKQQRSNNKKS